MSVSKLKRAHESCNVVAWGTVKKTMLTPWQAVGPHTELIDFAACYMLPISQQHLPWGLVTTHLQKQLHVRESHHAPLP